MTSTAVLTEDSATVIADEPQRFQWGVAIAGAVAAVAVSSFLIILGSGFGLALTSPTARGVETLLTMGAIYFFAAQAFGFTVGGYLVGRLIGPEPMENRKEEEFRAAAHGMVMWAVAVVAGLLIAGFTAGIAGTAVAVKPADNQAAASSYWMDALFRPAPNDVRTAADKQEAARIWTRDTVRGFDASDNDRLARLVAQDAGIPMGEATDRIGEVQAGMRQDADAARKTAASAAIWTGLALLFGLVLSIAAAISARWLDDRVTFSMARRY